MPQYFPQEGIFVHSFIHSKNIDLVTFTCKSFMIDPFVEDTNE